MRSRIQFNIVLIDLKVYLFICGWYSLMLISCLWVDSWMENKPEFKCQNLKESSFSVSPLELTANANKTWWLYIHMYLRVEIINLKLGKLRVKRDMYRPTKLRDHTYGWTTEVGKIQGFEVRSFQSLDFWGCYTHKRTKICMEKHVPRKRGDLWGQ